MRVLDLFSGLGGFSEAFVQAGDEVVRVENNPLLSEVPCTSIQFEPSMKLLKATLDIIKITKPRYWVIENVIGSISYFSNLGLTPSQIHGPHVLYGKYPKFNPGPIPTKASKDKTSTHPLRANHKALVPFSISSALREAIIQQKTLFDFE
jgi:hypothetical protein